MFFRRWKDERKLQLNDDKITFNNPICHSEASTLCASKHFPVFLLNCTMRAVMIAERHVTGVCEERAQAGNKITNYLRPSLRSALSSISIVVVVKCYALLSVSLFIFMRRFGFFLLLHKTFFMAKFLFNFMLAIFLLFRPDMLEYMYDDAART